MVLSNGLGAGVRYDQHEPLMARIKNLIHDYPEGVGILKELIQNADDAGAIQIDINVNLQRRRTCGKGERNEAEPKREVV